MIKIKVPSSSANLGPGFDTLAMALGLYSEYSFEIIEKGIEITGLRARPTGCPWRWSRFPQAHP